VIIILCKNLVFIPLFSNVIAPGSKRARLKKLLLTFKAYNSCDLLESADVRRKHLFQNPGKLRSSPITSRKTHYSGPLGIQVNISIVDFPEAHLK
jgi:hypothetical protein